MINKENNYHSVSDKYLKTPDGALIRYQNWLPMTSSNIKPRILILQGRATFIENFDHVVAQLQGRGYEVWAFDWRGQGLSTRELGRRGHIDSYETYLKDLDLFIREFLKKDDQNCPLIFLGQSMGGHIGLRYMAEHPGMVDGAIMTAPMLGLNTGVYPKALAQIITNAFAISGFKNNYVIGHGDYDPTTEPFEGNLLTRNKELFYAHRRMQIKHPEFVLCSPTFSWVRASMESLDILLRKEYISKIQAPVWIYGAGEEKVVNNAILPQACKWMGQGRLEIIPDARHQLLFELEDVQKKIYDGVDTFVQTHFDIPVQVRDVQKVLVPERARKAPVFVPAPIQVKI